MKKGRILTVKGNVLEPQRINKDEFVIIPHCCNTLGLMSAGVALSLKIKWPKVYKKYSESRLVLGNIFWEQVEDNIAVINMIGQEGVRSTYNETPVKYSAIVKAMNEIVSRIDWTPVPLVPLDKKIVFHCAMFCSDLAGGDWVLILDFIREIWQEKGYDVVIYEFEPYPEKWGTVGSISKDAYTNGDNDYTEEEFEILD